MNGLFRLLENFDARALGSPLQRPVPSSDGHEFALRFADASRAVDGDALDSEQSAEMLLDKAETDILLPGPPSHPDTVVDVKEPATIAIAQGENGSSAPSLKGENMTDETSVPSDTKSDRIGRRRNQAALDISKDILGMGQGGDDQPMAKSLVTSGTLIDQKIRTAAPLFENAIPRDQKSFPDNHLIKSAGEKSANKFSVQDDAPVSVARAVLPINQTLSPMASSPLIDIASVAPMAIRPTAATAPPLPTLDTVIDDQWVARLSQEIGKLTGEKTRLSFQLKPQNLGKLHVEIMSDAAGNVVRVDTDSEIAKQLILGAQGRLEQDIRLTGSKLVRVDVTHQEQSGSQSGHNGPDTQGRRPAIERGEYASNDGSLAEPLLPATRGPDGSSSHLGARYA